MASKGEQTAATAVPLAAAGFGELWQSAVNTLSKDDQETLEIHGDSNLTEEEARQKTKEALKKALDDAKREQDTLDERRRKSKVTFHGKDHTLHDIWASILGGIEKIKNFIDPFIALDVSGKAALPWAVVKIILGTISYPHDQCEAASSGMASITLILGYYAEFEPLYLDRESEVVTTLKRTITGVYELILEFLCRVKSYYRLKNKEKFLESIKTLGQSSPKKYAEIIASIETEQKKVQTWANLAQANTIREIRQQTENIAFELHSENTQKLLKWLSPISSTACHGDISKKRLPDSGLWLLRDKDYQTWRYSERSSLLWLSGSIGTGKSTLVSLVVDSFLGNPKKAELSPVLYFYCEAEQVPSGKATIATSPEEVLRNIIRQLLLSDPAIKTADLESYRRNGTALSSDSCLTKIKELLKGKTSVTFVIDALDNCVSLKDSTYTYTRLLSDLIELMETLQCETKILVSSQRYEGRVERFLRECTKHPKFEICVDDQDDVRHDVKQFIRYEVGSWKDYEFPYLQDKPGEFEEAKQNIIQTVTGTAGQMFLWAAVTLQGIFHNDRLRSKIDVDKELESVQKSALPSGSAGSRDLRALYDRLYNNISGPTSSDSDKRAVLALKFLLCGRKKLTTPAFVHAIEVLMPSDSSTTKSVSRNNKKIEYHGDYHSEATKLMDSCQGLIIHDEIRGVLRFLHPSIAQYLREKTGFEIDAHAQMSEACLSNVLSEDSGQGVSAIHFSGSTPQNQSQGTSGSRARGRTPTLGQGNESSSSRTPSRSSSRTSSRSSSRNRPRSQTGDDYADDPHSRSNANRKANVRESMKDSISLSDEPIQYFNDYATLFWAFHCDRCGEDRRQAGRLDEFLKKLLPQPTLTLARSKFNLWIADVERLVSQVPLGFYDRQIENELEHCTMPPATPFHVCCVYGFTEVIRRLCPESPPKRRAEKMRVGGAIDPSKIYAPSEPNVDGLSGMHMACIFSRADTVSYLIKLNCPQFWSSDNMGRTALYYAIEATEKNTEIVRMLVESYLLRIEVLTNPDITSRQGLETDQMVAGIFGSLDRVLVAGMRNRRSDQDLVRLLMDLDNSVEYRPFTPIEQSYDLLVADDDRRFDLFVAAATYRYTSLDLFGEVKWLPKVTEDLVDLLVAVASSTRGAEVEWARREELWDYFLRDFHHGKTPILIAAVKTADTELVQYLLQPNLDDASDETLEVSDEGFDEIPEVSDEIPAPKVSDKILIVSNEILLAAASNSEVSYELMEFLLMRSCHRISCIVIESALENPAIDINLIAKLRVLGTTTRTKAMLVAMAMNRDRGAEMLLILTAKLNLEREDNDSVSLDEGTSPDPDIKSRTPAGISREAFLEIEDTIESIEEINPEAMEWRQDLSRKLDFTGNVENWEEVIEAAVTNGNPAVLKAMFESGVHIKISKECFCFIVAGTTEEDFLRKTRGKYTTGLAFEDPEDEWDSQIMASIVLLFDNGVATTDMITQDMVDKAARTRGRKLIGVLFDRNSSGVEVSKNMVNAAVRNTLYGHNLLLFLQERTENHQLSLDDDLRQSIASHGTIKTVALFLNKPLTAYDSSISLAAASNPSLNVIEFLFRDTISVGSAELEAAAANSDAALECLMPHKLTPSSPEGTRKLGKIVAENCRWTKTLELAYGRRFTELDAGVEELIHAAAKNRNGIEMLRYLFRRWRAQPTRGRPGAFVSTSMFEAAARNQVFAPEMLRVLQNECSDTDVDSLITESVLVKAAANGREAAAALRILLLEDGVPMNLTASVVRAAWNNHDGKKKALDVLEGFWPNHGRRFSRVLGGIKEDDKKAQIVHRLYADNQMYEEPSSYMY